MEDEGRQGVEFCNLCGQNFLRALSSKKSLAIDAVALVLNLERERAGIFGPSFHVQLVGEVGLNNTGGNLINNKILPEQSGSFC